MSSNRECMVCGAEGSGPLCAACAEAAPPLARLRQWQRRTVAAAALLLLLAVPAYSLAARRLAERAASAQRQTQAQAASASAPMLRDSDPGASGDAAHDSAGTARQTFADPVPPADTASSTQGSGTPSDAIAHDGLANRSTAPTHMTTSERQDANANAGTAAGGTEGWTTYHNPILRFSMAHPAGWQVDSAKLDATTTRVTLRTPSPDVQVIVDVASGSSYTAPAESWRDMDRRLQIAYGPRYRCVAIEAAALGNMGASRWTFTLQKAGTPLLRKVDIGAVSSGKGYALLFAAPADSFTSWQPTFERMQRSFAFDGFEDDD